MSTNNHPNIDQTLEAPKRPVPAAMLAATLFGGIAMGLAAYIVAQPSPPEHLVTVPGAGTGPVASDAAAGSSAQGAIASVPTQVPPSAIAFPPAGVQGPVGTGASQGTTEIVNVLLSTLPASPPEPEPMPAPAGPPTLHAEVPPKVHPELPEQPKPEPATPQGPKPTPQQKPAGDPPTVQPAPQMTTVPPKPKPKIKIPNRLDLMPNPERPTDGVTLGRP